MSNQTNVYIVLLALSLNSIFIKPCTAQEDTHTGLIQFSGVIVTGDSLIAVPFANIIIKGTYRGTISDFFGYFSFVAKKNDTIMFSSVGFKKAHFTIPDTLTTNRYSLIQVIFRDTIMLPEAVIFPWPTRDQFRQAFLTLNMPDDDLERAKKNLDREIMKEQFDNMGMDASMNYTNYIQRETSRLYWAGQYPPNNLLNPIAWMKFIEAWQRGDFKRK